MNTRYTGILVILGAILAAAVFVSSGKGNDALRARHHQQFFGFDSGLVSVDIAFDGGRESVSLQHEDGAWFVVNPGGEPHLFPVDVATIEPVLSILSTPLSGELRSTNPAHHAEYGVSNARSIRLTPYGDGRAILIGTTGPDRRSTFVRYADSNDVYLVPRPIEFNFRQRRTARDWRSTVVVSAPVDRVARLDIMQRGEPRLSFSREGRDWRVAGAPEGFRADPSMIAGLIGNLNTVRASEFIDDADGDYGFGEPLLVIALTDPAEVTRRLVIGSPEDSTGTRYFARGTEGEGVVLVGAFFVERSVLGLIQQLRATLPTLAGVETNGADAGAAPGE